MFSVRRYVIYFTIGFLLFLVFRSLRDESDLDRVHRNTDGSRIPKTIQWDRVHARYPVKSVTKLPSGPPKRLPRVQHAGGRETAEEFRIRRSRLNKVKATFSRSWSAYRERAWMHDEVGPLSGKHKDPFGGWGATLVDNLDTLWIMGMRAEFEEAVVAAVKIDTSNPTIESINVFETTIRHLGGLLSAHDLSGDERLLRKATEFGHMLLKAFDTPNRMPVTRWDPRKALTTSQEASSETLLAEIGSLCMEFTRLSQVTGNPIWYDATDRIKKLFASQQNETQLPGMWPVVVNAQKMDLTKDISFTLNSMADSTYEYFPKMYALLGGLDEVYRELYNGSMTTALQHTIWRPMVPGNADILMSGSVRASWPSLVMLDPETQHLACFTGGMYALGGKIFDIPAHVEVGKKLTEGCIWAYESSASGIMPESFRLTTCADRNQCSWSEKAWHDEVNKYSGPSEDIDAFVKQLRLPKGFTEISDRRYGLRPEAIESVFIMYRITGDRKYQEAAWRMFEAIVHFTETDIAYAMLSDVTYATKELLKAGAGGVYHMDNMESFWMSETLKYFYLIFSEPDVISLDEYVL